MQRTNDNTTAYDEYAAIEAMNFSSLKHMHESPRAYRWWTEHERGDTPAMAMGRAIHTMVLEGRAEYWRRYHVKPPRPGGADGRAKKGSPEKVAYAAWRAACETAAANGGEEISFSDQTIINAVADAVREHPAARAELMGVRTEVTIQWVDEDTGVACKARLDALTHTRVADLKTTAKPLTPALVTADMARRLYHAQLAYYHDGAIAAGHLPRDAEPPAIVVAQTVAPYDVAVYRLADFVSGSSGYEVTTSALRAGRHLYRQLLRRYVECRDTDWWPGMAPSPLTLELPAWAPGMREALGWTDDDQPDFSWAFGKDGAT